MRLTACPSVEVLASFDAAETAIELRRCLYRDGFGADESVEFRSKESGLYPFHCEGVLEVVGQRLSFLSKAELQKTHECDAFYVQFFKSRMHFQAHHGGMDLWWRGEGIRR